MSLSIGSFATINTGVLEGYELVVSKIDRDRVEGYVGIAGKSAKVSVVSSHLTPNKINATPYESRNIVEVEKLSRELISNLASNPEELYELDPRKFEELVAELLRDMGNDVHLTPQTRDGGRDILVLSKLYHAEILTIVECKRFAKSYKVGSEILERLLWIAEQKDRASIAMVVTTSTFTKGAREIERNYHWKLTLKDYFALENWLSRYGSWEIGESSGVWIPSWNCNKQ